MRLENEEKAKADFANAFDVVATVPEQVLIALREKNANELQKQFGLKKSEVSRAQNLIMEWEVKPDEPSVIAPGAYKPNATRFAQLFQKLGVRVELVPAAYKTTEHSTDEDLQPRAAGSSPEASEDVLAQIEKLGQLHDAGALTDEEFQAKKAELIRRPHS